MQHGADLLKKCPVQVLCNGVLCRCVMNGESMFSSCSLQVCLECVTQIFPTMVHMQLADAHVHLCLAPCFIFLIGTKDLAFLAQEVEMGESHAVVHEGHIVLMLM